jgi:hypothetical protein
MILRPGKTPSGVEVRGHIRRLVRAIRRHWPTTKITIRGDGHYCRPEVMDWCEAHGVDYVFGLTGTKALAAKVEEVADAIRVERAIDDKDAVRGFAEITHAARSWTRERRVSARIEATRFGLDIRYVVTNIASGTAEWLYANLYCARGQAENLIKLHKAQLASDRTSCRAATANQMRLVLHTAAYWLVLAVRDAIPDGPCPRQGRVQHHPAQASQDRHPRHRDRQPGARRLRQRLPGCRSLPLPGRLDQVRRALSHGASGPRKTLPPLQPAPQAPAHDAVKNTPRRAAIAFTQPQPPTKIPKLVNKAG